MALLICVSVINIAFFIYNLWYNRRVTRLLEECERIVELLSTPIVTERQDQ